ncbi:MAG TPA: ribosome-associated translation inhibitor RaiA [Patescibacteria group bacterium]
MKITIKGTNIKLTPEIKDYIDQKLNSLDKFVKGILEALVEVGKTSQHHRTGQVFRAEADLRLPGKVLRAEAVAGDLNTAVNQVKDELQRQLKKYKNRQEAKSRRGQRVLKRELHLDPRAKSNREKKSAEGGSASGGKGGRELDEGSLQ